jgi:hypothetical protein
MAEFREDNLIYPTIIQMVACLCTEIAESGLPEPCSCGPIVGDLILDYCGQCADGKCGGQAWVRLVDSYPSIDFPTPNQALNNCAAPIAYQLEVGIARCKPVGSTSGVRGFVPPSLEQQVAALRLQTADMAAVRRAVQCCLGDDTIDYILGSYIPLTGEADCLGGAFQVWVRGPY